MPPETVGLSEVMVTYLSYVKVEGEVRLNGGQMPFRHEPTVQAEPVGTHVPVLSHVCGCWPEHCVAPGLHATHTPSRHAGVAPAHATGDPQLPVPCSASLTCVGGVCSGVCGPSQTQCLGNGVETCDGTGSWWVTRGARRSDTRVPGRSVRGVQPGRDAVLGPAAADVRQHRHVGAHRLRLHRWLVA